MKTNISKFLYHLKKLSLLILFTLATTSMTACQKSEDQAIADSDYVSDETSEDDSKIDNSDVDGE